MKFEEYFRYDESSPSCLVWAKDVYKGRARNILAYAEGEPCGSIHRDGHWSVAFRVNGRQVRRYCHRIIWKLVHGECDDSLVIDHIDGDRSNNKLLNLRLVVKKVNARNQNMNPRNTSGIAGVSFCEIGQYSYAVASWVTDNGEQKLKRFPIHKLGFEEAFKLAKEYREARISEINETSESAYTERHGRKQCD